jgi:pimeloyl-ACP methyl ester carboxylesterase
MSNQSEVLWLSTSPSLQCFSEPFLRYLSRSLTVKKWEYYQTEDEPSSLDIAILLLHDYLKSCNQQFHLIGHSTGGLLGLLYARRYPEKVKSLTLLSVGIDAAIDWQAHYYTHRQHVSRQKILKAMVYNLFGYQNEPTVERLMKILSQDLDCSLSPNSLFQRLIIPPGSVPVPLMVCGSFDDAIIQPHELQGWQPWLKSTDRLWFCLEGGHFFHFFQSQMVAEKILSFWQSLQQLDSLYSCLNT